MKTKHIPSSLEVSVCVTYAYSPNSSTKLSEYKFRLPLKLIMKAGQQSITEQQQENEPKLNKSISNIKKIVLESNKPCVNLNEIFPEFAGSYVATNGNILVGQYFGHTNTNISIQGSKTGQNRYKIQSESLDKIWLVANEFVLRLNSYYSKQSTDVSITYNEQLPTEELKNIIDKHLDLRKNMESLSQNLEQCSVQFRAIQKRLLTKFKDKSPTVLDNMDALLEATFRQISTISEKYLATKNELSIVTNSLNSMSSLYVLLLSLVFKFSKESIEILDSVMTTQIPDTSELVKLN